MNRSAPHLLPLLSALLVLACGPEPGAPPLAATARPIINGKACTAADQQTAVGVITDATMNIWGYKLPVRTISCTGTLIAPDVVLTAAHCVTPSMLTMGMGTVESAKYYVSFSPDLTGLVMDQASIISGKKPALPADAVEGSAYLPHPGFSPSLLAGFKGGLSNLYDVALIFLKKEVTAVKPAVVITADEAKQIAVNKAVNISGWGQQTAAKQNPFAPPAKGTVGKKVCAASFINEIGKHEMQIGSDEQSSRKCHGDSGGPSFMTVATSHARTERVVGITSHAYDKTDCKKGGVDTRVDAWLTWIDAEMKKRCQDGSRVWCEVQGIIPPSYYDPKPDLGVDAGPEAGSAADGGAEPPAEQDEGCECRLRAGADRAASPVPLLLLLLAATLTLRLRRRK